MCLGLGPLRLVLVSYAVYMNGGRNRYPHPRTPNSCADRLSDRAADCRCADAGAGVVCADDIWSHGLDMAALHISCVAYGIPYIQRAGGLARSEQPPGDWQGRGAERADLRISSG